MSLQSIQLDEAEMGRHHELYLFSDSFLYFEVASKIENRFTTATNQEIIGFVFLYCGGSRVISRRMLLWNSKRFVKGSPLHGHMWVGTARQHLSSLRPIMFVFPREREFKIPVWCLATQGLHCVYLRFRVASSLSVCFYRW